VRLTLATLLVVAAVVGSLGAVAPAAGAQSTECSNTVRYDEFRTDNATVSSAANESTTVQKENTEARIEQAAGFIRLNATNPNGYCVEYTVQIADDVVDPAELGNVDSNDGNATADWQAIRDFETDETFTSVSFVLPADSSATFAASDLRVKSLSWTGEAKRAGSGFLHWVDGFSWGSDDDPLKERTYTFTAEDNSTYVSVSLANESTGQRVDDWQAMYRTPDGEWTPISTDSGDPVFYRNSGEDTIQFVFNDQDAEIEFTANPTWRDKAGYQVDSYLSGWDALKNFSLFGDSDP